MRYIVRYVFVFLHVFLMLFKLIYMELKRTDLQKFIRDQQTHYRELRVEEIERKAEGRNGFSEKRFRIRKLKLA